ncbi:MAG: hypothetical protein ACRCXC_10695 [Legionella sp.]
MVYSKQNEAFSKNKTQFFMQLPNAEIPANIDEIKKRAKHVDYTFLLQNQKALEEEFTQMFAVLQKRKSENEEAFWMYCYYCATLLEVFYKGYSHNELKKGYKRYGNEAKYHDLKKKIKKRLLTGKYEDDVAEKEFIKSLKKSFIEGFNNLMNSPFHSSKIRDYVVYSNICRVHWVFTRLTFVNGFTLAKDLAILEKLDSILGTHTDVDKIISAIQAPNGVLNYFSVGLFLMRFMIDAGQLIRHTCFPTEAEQTALERFKYELYKRHCNFINDLVWATVNFLTNFSQITQISGPAASALTAAFLGFDVCMLLYKCHLAKQEYLIKKAQYEQELDDYTNHHEKFPEMTLAQRLAHIAMLNGQLKELEIGWKTKEGTLYFAASAAALLMLGFTASLLLTPPGMVVACFFVCSLGTAMYLSTDVYSKYKEKSLRLEQAQLFGEELQSSLKEYHAARNDFIFTMVKNTVMPTLLIATFAICWPAAVALTALYVGYEIYHAYNQHNSKHEAHQPVLEASKLYAEAEIACCM